MGNIAVYPKFRAFDNDGVPLAGGMIYTYETATTTPKAVYTNVLLTVPATNPVVLDSQGEALIYLSGSYRFVLKDSAGVTLWTQDDVETPGLSAASNVEAVAKTITTKALTPGNIVSIMASPGPIGATTPSTGKFTTLQLTTGVVAGKFATADVNGLIGWGDAERTNFITNSRLSVMSNGTPEGVGTNLITNGEEWTGATSTTPPTGWTVGIQGTYSITTGGGGYIAEGLKIQDTGAGKPSCYVDVTTVVGQLYVVKGWLKKGSSTSSILKIGKTTDDDYYALRTITDNVYTLVTLAFKAETTTTRITMAIDSLNGENGYFDTVSAYQSQPGCVAADTLALDLWDKESGVQIWRTSDATDVVAGSLYALKILGGASASKLFWSDGGRYQKSAFYSRFAGKALAFGCWIKSASASKTRIGIETNTGTEWSSYHTGGNAFEWIEVTTTPASNITSFRLIVDAGTSTTCWIAMPTGANMTSIGSGNWKPIPKEWIWFEKAVTSQWGLTVSFSTTAWSTLVVESDAHGRIPSGVRALQVTSSVRDASSETTETYFSLSPNGANVGTTYSNSVSGNAHIGAGVYQPAAGITPTNSDGNVQYTIAASGANNFKINPFNYTGCQVD